MKQIISAIKELHKFNIIHLNLHPKTIWLYSNGDVKVGNFSHSCNLGNESQTYNYSLQTIKFTDFLGPELKTGKAATLKTDIYSLGQIFGLMHYQTPDFKIKLDRDLK
jgi:serine/threonine protein kinase